MHSVRTRLTVAFGATVAVLLAVDLVVVFLYAAVINRYQEMTESMTEEHRLIEVSAGFVEAYNSVIKLSEDEGRLSKYEAYRGEFEAIFSRLNSRVTSKESALAYLGVKNTVNRLVSEGDNGIADVRRGDLESAYARYNEERRLVGFVKSNVTELLLQELAYAQTIEEEVTAAQRFNGLIVFLLIVLGVVGSVLYVLYISRNIIRPLAKLTVLARDIAGGKLNTDVPDRLRRTQDEIGSLASSFGLMVEKLRDKIEELEEARRRVESSSEEIRRNADELARMNKLMVGRELKMIELKKQIADLEKGAEKDGNA